MEIFFIFNLFYWLAMLLSGALMQIFTGVANDQTMHLFYLGLASTGIFLLCAVVYDYIELLVKNRRNTPEKKE